MIRAAFVGLGALCLSTAASADSSLIGDWTRQDGETRIKIAPCGAELCAVNTWVRDPKGDEKLGDTLVMTLAPKTPTVLSGQAYDKRRDITYSMTISLGQPGMWTHGCIMLGILCKNAEWVRTQSVPP